MQCLFATPKADRKGGDGVYVLNNSNRQECPQMPEDTENITESCGRQSQGNVYTQPTRSLEVEECSMCGDIGIFEHLFQCRKCCYRYQHTYCSRSYPNLGPEIWICNWCLHQDDKIQGKSSTSAENGGITGNSAFECLLQTVQSLLENCSSGDQLQPATAVGSVSNVTSSSHTRKRQRWNHAAEKSRDLSMDRWRHTTKNRLQLTPPKGIGRRYKLLADVLC